MRLNIFKHVLKSRDTQCCCIGFKSGYESAGNRGHAYLVGRDSLEAPEFLIQYRAVDKGEEDHIQSDIPDIPVSIVIDSRIVFCPSCGVNLAKFYKNNIDALHRDELEIGILKKHGNFLLTPLD